MVHANRDDKELGPHLTQLLAQADHWALQEDKAHEGMHWPKVASYIFIFRLHAFLRNIPHFIWLLQTMQSLNPLFELLLFQNIIAQFNFKCQEDNNIIKMIQLGHKTTTRRTMNFRFSNLKILREIFISRKFFSDNSR